MDDMYKVTMNYQDTPVHGRCVYSYDVLPGYTCTWMTCTYSYHVLTTHTCTWMTCTATMCHQHTLVHG